MKVSDIISKETYKKRMRICLACPSYEESFKRCKECGCFLILKAALKTTECPLNKWDKEKNEY